ncbi:MAG TPA: O-antigen ligase family protein [Solirubrobacterales bacterium]|nr:O-antigen ligase family protein [Solirubrobacterales bacterium]
MDAAASAPASRLPLELDWGGIWTWLLGFALVLCLGLNGGGYDQLVSDQVAIAAWWVLLLGVAVGALPRTRLGPIAWAALGLFALFLGWTLLSLTWTESSERTLVEVARIGGYVAIFALAVCSRGPRGARLLVGSVASAIVVVAAIALLSRLHPSWFPEGRQTARFLETGRERLSYPLNYWNALAALIAIGLPLLLQAASDARRIALRALSAAAIPLLILTIFFTLSRAGMAAAALAVVVYLAFAPDRLPRLAALAIAGAGGGALVVAALQRDDLRHGLLNATARHQGNEMLPLVVLVCVVVGLLVAALAAWLTRRERPRWTRVPPGLARVGVGAVVVVGFAVLLALFASGRVGNAWGEFKEPTGGPGYGTGRLSSASGESRYQFWSAAVKEAGSAPLTGTGAGTFEYWWTRHADVEGTIRDTHSLYLQTLGELGIVGIALLGGFLLLVLIGGGRAAIRADGERAPPLAAALAGCVAFCFTATFDWMWQVPVVPVAMLLLAAALVSAGLGDEPPSRTGFPIGARVGVVAVALALIVLTAIPLAATSLVRQSQEAAQADDLSAALDDAQTASDVEPFAATPRLQLALVYEEAGEFDRAAAAAAAATERESTNWRTWLVLARIEAERGRADAAVAAYREAKRLNPRSSVFTEG